jgi:hypothetical protein
MWTFVRYSAKGKISLLIFIVSVQETKNYQEKINFSGIIPEISSKTDIQRTLSSKSGKCQVCLRQPVILYHNTCAKLSFPLPRLYSDPLKAYFCTKNAHMSLHFDYPLLKKTPISLLNGKDARRQFEDCVCVCVCERERERERVRVSGWVSQAETESGLAIWPCPDFFRETCATFRVLLHESFLVTNAISPYLWSSKITLYKHSNYAG